MEDQSLLDRLNELLAPVDREVAGINLRWVILAAAGLVALVVLLLVVRGLWRALFGRRASVTPDHDRALREDLATYPRPAPASGGQSLTVYHVPVRLRLV